jgi:hypothetical protein
MQKTPKKSKINKQLVDKIKNKIDILKLVEDLGFSVVKSSNDRWVMCCLFHEERTPSMTLYKDSNSFYCYGCTESGDVITLLQKAKGLSFVEAVKFLAKRGGIDVESSNEETFHWEGSDEYSEEPGTELDYEDIFTFVAMETRKLIEQIKDVYSTDSVEFNEAVSSMESIYQKFDNTDVSGVKMLALSQLEGLANELRETLNESRGHRGHSYGGILPLWTHT